MDAGTAYLIQRIDRIDRQLGELLRRQEQRQSLPVVEGEKTGLFSRLNKLPLPLQWLAGGVASWGISAGIASYIKHGGDPTKVIDLLHALFT